MLNAAPLTRPQRQELLRLLLLGRGLERVLASLRRRTAAASGGESEAVLAAIAAAAGLQSGDRLIAPHGFLAAHLAVGVGPAEIAAARLREPTHGVADRRMRAAIGPQSPVGIAVGAAFALSRTGRRDAAVALVDRRWAEEEGCRGALALARELALPLVVVAIDTGAATDATAPTVDRRDFEAIRVAVATAINGAHDDRGPSLVVCAPGAREEHVPENHVARFRSRVEDPVADYERWLMIHGFARAELDAIRRTAAGELDAAVGDRVARAHGKRIVAEGAAK